MAPPLVVRNVTNVPFELKLMERFEAPEATVEREGKNLFANVTSALGVNTTVAPSAAALAENAQSFERRDVGFRIDPFQTTGTDIQASARGPNEILRLTFEIEDQKYRIDVPSPKASSSTLVPLDPNPRHQFTGVFIVEENYLAIFSSADLNCWMRHLRDDTQLSALSIPGTHNAPTHHRALPSVRCQARSPKEQLENGVRFFDIRVQVESRQSSNLQLVHSVFPISLTGPKMFRDHLLKHVYEFLDGNPSETLIISIKREGTGTASDQDLAHVLLDHYTSGEESRRWYTDVNVPSLGQVRGKIVLMRRFGTDDEINRQNEGRGFGVDATSWADNTPCSQAGNLCIQDFYEVLETENIEKKIGYAQAHLERAGDCVASQGPQPFFINFLSASNFWKPGCWPDRIAAKLNPAITKWLCCNHAQDRKGDGSTGIVITDWVGDQDDWDIVRCIVGFNTKLMTRQ